LRKADEVITDRKRIALELAHHSTSLPMPSGAASPETEAKIEQIFTFAYDSVEPSCSTNHPDMFSVLEVSKF